mgnify:FL=1
MPGVQSNRDMLPDHRGTHLIHDLLLGSGVCQEAFDEFRLPFRILELQTKAFCLHDLLVKSQIRIMSLGRPAYLFELSQYDVQFLLKLFVRFQGLGEAFVCIIENIVSSASNLLVLY